MDEQHPSPPPGKRHGHDFLTYSIGGIIAWGLVGLALDYLLDTRGIVIAGALLGAVGGFFLARFHQRHRRPEETPHQ